MTHGSASALLADRGGDGLAEALADANEDLLERMAQHPWVQSLARGTLPQPALVRWAQQCRLFCLLERPALLHLRSLIDPGELDDLLARLTDDTVRESGQLAEMLTRLGAPVTEQRLLDCLGYGSYVHSCAVSGRLEGLTAVYAVEVAYLDTWTSVLPYAAPDSPYRGWIENWSGDEFAAVVNGIGTALSRLAGPPAAALERLGPVFRNVMRWELALWDAVWIGENPARERVA